MVSSIEESKTKQANGEPRFDVEQGAYRLKQLPEDFCVDEIPLRELSDSGEYSVFKLWKRDYTTEDAIQQISRMMGKPRKLYGAAGNKDKRAVTTQYCSFRGQMRDIETPDMKAKFVGKTDSQISLGDLAGNSFRIVIRNLDNDALKPIAPEKMINYFDTQRFGVEGNNHIIGRFILKRDFASAAKGIVGPSDEMLSHLERSPNDYIGALRRIPKRTISLYINAYQSDLWNRGVKEYINDTDIEHKEFPLIGYGTEYSDKRIRQICERMLAEDGLTQRDFAIREFPELSSEGNTRPIIAEITNLEIGNIEDDEFNPGKKKLYVSFNLGKGSYATMVIRELISSIYRAKRS